MRSTLIPAAVLISALAASLLAQGCGTTAPKSAEDKGRASVALYKEGVESFNQGRIDAGIAALKKAKDIQPDYTLLRYDLGRMLLVRAERGDLTSMQLVQEAKNLRQESKVEEGKRKEDEAITLHRNAMIDLQESLGHFSYAETQWPYEANVPYFLSIVRTGLGEFDKAKEDLDRSIELANPQGPQREKLMRARKLLETAQLTKERLEKGN